jgi:hypothetical protein
MQVNPLMRYERGDLVLAANGFYEKNAAKVEE